MIFQALGSDGEIEEMGVRVSFIFCGTLEAGVKFQVTVFNVFIIENLVLFLFLEGGSERLLLRTGEKKMGQWL